MASPPDVGRSFVAHQVVSITAKLLRTQAKRQQRWTNASIVEQFHSILKKTGRGSFLHWSASARTKSHCQLLSWLVGQEHLSGCRRWSCPISHLVELDGTITQDASTGYGMGGYSAQLEFWWQISWASLDAAIVELILQHTLHVNVLELTAIFINFFGAGLSFTDVRFPGNLK